MIGTTLAATGSKNLGLRICINPAHTTRCGLSASTSLASSESYSSRAFTTSLSCFLLYVTKLWYAMGIPAVSALVRPNADLRFDITRTKRIGREGSAATNFLLATASIRACRFVPLPEIKTVIRNGDCSADICRLVWFYLKNIVWGKFENEDIAEWYTKFKVKICYNQLQDSSR
jgi:hypothetical protein